MANLQSFGSGFYRCMVYKTYVLINSNVLSDPENRTKNNPNTALILLLWVMVLFLLKNTDLEKKEVGISKINGSWY